MAFDYGSIDLGIRNPFKKEGAVNTLRGLLVTAIGIYFLIYAASQVSSNVIVGWIGVAFGLGFLGNGIAITSGGAIAMMRYFVGRSHPTSLAYNFSRSALSTAKGEKNTLVYNRSSLTEMLVGRKNMTFDEPQGFLARFLHSVLSQLTYMPSPVRNMAQRLFASWVKTLVALVAYGFVAFVSLTGLAGEIGRTVLPMYSIALTIYVLLVWASTGKAINRLSEKKVFSISNASFIRTIAGAILLPVLIGVMLQVSLSFYGLSIDQFNRYMAYLPKSYALLYITGSLIIATAVTYAVWVMLEKRMKYANPKTEVSELRENWQESVHPNEIFINLDNLVMANRRYKEVPNRIYQELEPKLNEQVKGKGNFFGEMIQEVQPQFKAMNLGKLFEKTRLVSLLCGNLLLTIATFIILMFAFELIDAYLTFTAQSTLNSNEFTVAFSTAFSEHAQTLLHLFLIGALVRGFGLILSNAAHLFFAEMQFESNLIYFKLEGTFTESKISTGASIHDSTRSENTLVRSSITPWVIVSRIVSSTFAASGMRNLEFPRFVLEMHKNDQELNNIRQDVVGFLKDRESIAAITSERDLHNASQIHQINQQSRSIPTQHSTTERLTKPDEQAAGYLQQEENRKSE